jgi:hypothetical protein
VVGGTGTGKSALLKVIKRSFLNHGIRIMDLDNAMEMVDWYRHFAPRSYPVRCISMQHADGVGINFAQLIGSPTIRMLFAKLLIVDSTKESNRFFVDMARIVISNVCKVLHRLAPGKALLADIIGVAIEPDLHVELAKIAKIKNPYATFGSNDSKRDTITTITSRLESFQPFAAMDKNCAERVTLPHADGALVLEWSYKHAEALNAIYALLFEYSAIEWLSDQRNLPVAAFIDEFRFLEKMGFIVPMINQGRKFNISLFLTMHSVLGVYERYGKELGGEIIASPEYKMFLANPCVDTAQWGSKYLGETEVREDLENRENKWSVSIKMRPNVLPDEVRHSLKKADFNGDVIEGYADFPGEITRFKSKFRHAVIIDRQPAPRPLLPDDATEFESFSRVDLARLGITCTEGLDDFFNGVKKKKKEDDDDEPEPTTEDFNRTINLSGQAKRPRGRPRKNPE